MADAVDRTTILRDGIAWCRENCRSGGKLCNRRTPCYVADERELAKLEEQSNGQHQNVAGQ